MKIFISLAFFMLITTYDAQAQLIQLSCQQNNATGSYSTSNFTVCATNPEKRTFKLFYNHCPGGGNCIEASMWCLGSTEYRYTMTLYDRNSNIINRQQYTATSVWSNSYYYNVPIDHPGEYRGHIKVEKRAWKCQWTSVNSGWSNIIYVRAAATPNFDINGTAIAFPAGNQVIGVCQDEIKMNAASTSCETAYNINVQECEANWTVTGQYGWDRWFQGQAPNNIDLQAIASNPSAFDNYLGDLTRKGELLKGGNLPSGQVRYYRVNICVHPWVCRTVLIQIRTDNHPSCFDGDQNQPGKIQITPNPNTAITTQAADQPITVSFEGDNINTEIEEVELENSSNFSSFSNVEQTNITVTPNPFNTSTIVHINNYDGQNPITFELFNGLGKRVKSIQTQGNQFELQKSNLATGIYIYRATNNGAIVGSGKIIIQ